LITATRVCLLHNFTSTIFFIVRPICPMPCCLMPVFPQRHSCRFSCEKAVGAEIISEDLIEAEHS